MHTVNGFKFLPHSKHLTFVFCSFNFYEALELSKSRQVDVLAAFQGIGKKAVHTLKQDILFRCSCIKAPVEKIHIQLDP